MYWKAYALNRLGKRDEAISRASTSCVKKFPSSRWIRRREGAAASTCSRPSGQPVSPEQTADEELKLIALNGLMARDPDRGDPDGRADPQRVGVAEDEGARPVRAGAERVAARQDAARRRSRRARATPTCSSRRSTTWARSGAGPTSRSCVDVYKSTTDIDVKKRVIRSLGMTGRRGVGLRLRLRRQRSHGQRVRATPRDAYGQAMDEARAALDRAKVGSRARTLAQDQADRVRIEIDQGEDRARAQDSRPRAPSARRRGRRRPRRPATRCGSSTRPSRRST